MPAELQDLATKIQEVIRGPFVRTLLVIFLCASAITYAFNKDNEKVKRNCIAVGVAAGILVAAVTLVDAIFPA
jgi:type IV secretory pathway VirB2 component (pilin)